MDLQSNETSLFDRFVGFGVIDSLTVVDPKLDVTTFAQDAVSVPFAELQNFRQLVLVR